MIKAKSIGGLAWEALEQRWQADVMGVTSGGVFLRVNGDRILFLTYSPFRGPQTINLEWDRQVDLQENQVGSQVFLDPYRITIPNSRLGVWLQGAEIWRPGFPSQSEGFDFKAAAERLQRIGLAAATQKGAQGFGPFIPGLVAGQAVQAVGDLTEGLIASLEQADRAACRQDYPELINQARSWVGYGRGLTPAGDDCLAGIVLVLNRWGSKIGLKVERDWFYEAMISLAAGRTTLLSSTIIRAAALGQADERILRILDGIFLGDDDEPDAIRNLVRMGHSSGVDTLTGISLVLAGVLLRTCVHPDEPPVQPNRI